MDGPVVGEKGEFRRSERESGVGVRTRRPPVTGSAGSGSARVGASESKEVVGDLASTAQVIPRSRRRRGGGWLVLARGGGSGRRLPSFGRPARLLRVPGVLAPPPLSSPGPFSCCTAARPAWLDVVAGALLHSRDRFRPSRRGGGRRRRDSGSVSLRACECVETSPQVLLVLGGGARMPQPVTSPGPRRLPSPFTRSASCLARASPPCSFYRRCGKRGKGEKGRGREPRT